jgi:subfamily B ATP-binding cassette protein MsbA
MQTLRRALRYMAAHWALQLAALAFALIVTASGFVWPFFTKYLIDKVMWPQDGTAGQRLHWLNLLTLVALATSVLGSLAAIGRSWLFALAGERAAADMRRDLFDHVHHLPMATLDRRRTGGVMSVVQSDVDALQGLYSSTLVDILTNLLTATAAATIMVVQSPKLAAIGLPVPILFAVALSRFGPALRTAGRQTRDETERVQNVLQESVSGAREVRVFGRASDEGERFMASVHRLIGARVRMAALGAANGSVTGIIATVGMMLTMVVGARMAIRGEMTAGNVVMTLNVLGMLFGPASSFVNLFSQVAAAIGAADRVFEFLDAPSEPQPDRPCLAPPCASGVEFRGVGFRYDPDEPDVLHDVSLTVTAGEVAALVGPSGSGKTTLVSLLPRLYDVTEGSLLIDGVDVRDVPPFALRSLIAVVPQEPFLFATTVRANIAFGRSGATAAEVEEAARAANAHDFITALPHGYETEVGERGARLSVGQKQRLAIARAILRDPRVLILDEATSAQDSESERLVQEAMGRLMRGRTCFVIAHRLATVRRADRIVVLEAGRVVERGTHHDLLQGKGLYARLHSLQFADDEANPDGAYADATPLG